MKSISFKPIPFIISLLIVIGSVTGICLYSYYKFDNNMLRFTADYLHYEDYSTVDTEKQIEDYVKLSSEYYQVVESGLSYYDVKSGNKYTNNPSNSSKDQIRGATWNNGVLHVPGYFDVKAYAVTTWNKDTEAWIFSYYFYLFNVNYTKADLIDHLYFCFVDGIGESNGETELFGVTKLNQVMKEIKNGQNGGPDTVNTPSFTYTGNNTSSKAMYIHDNNATGLTGDTTPYVYRLTTMGEVLSEESTLDDDIKSRLFSELKETTFSIFYSGSKDIYSATTDGDTLSDMKEIVRGTYEATYNTGEDFNKGVNDENTMIYKGYGSDLFKAGYGKFIWPTILLHGAITFLISGILAVLFYLIWQTDDEDVIKQNDRIKKIKQMKKNK